MRFLSLCVFRRGRVTSVADRGVMILEKKKINPARLIPRNASKKGKSKKTSLVGGKDYLIT